MFFNINPSNGVPVYEQIARQIIFAIASGGIDSGEMVPSVRALSKELAVNPNTVSRAYRQLQDSQVLETVRGEGLIVTRNAVTKCQKTRQQLVADRIFSAIEEAHQSQLTVPEIKTLVDKALATSKTKTEKRKR
ncbi:MAG: GntR family transcriptional regulator [Planctomycetota bacterium]